MKPIVASLVTAAAAGAIAIGTASAESAASKSAEVTALVLVPLPDGGCEIEINGKFTVEGGTVVRAGMERFSTSGEMKTACGSLLKLSLPKFKAAKGLK